MIQLTGILGAIILVCGAAYPIKQFTHPVKSTKNWLFAIGGFLLFIYSLLNWMAGGPIFFVFLQILVNISSILMMTNTPEKIATPILSLGGLILIIWSLALFEGYNTLFFIIGLTGIAIGYVLDPGTFKRNMTLTISSILLALFSYLANDQIFFWLNTIYVFFSGHHAWKLRNKG